MFENARQDVRFAWRLLRRSPVFTVTAALSLALGIGANTTIFSIANALMLRPLPGLSDPGRLVDVGRTDADTSFDTVSYPTYRDIQERSTTLDGLYAYEIEPRAMSLGGRGDAERVYGAIVSGNYFTLLGTHPAAGRLLTTDDDVAGKPQDVVVISHELWTRRLGGDAGLIGQQLLINGHPMTVIGVTPRGFQGTTLLKSEVWVPMTNLGAVRRDPYLLTSRRSSWLFMGGRLKEGATVSQLRSELTSIATALEREHPDSNRGRGLTAAQSEMFPGQMTMIGGFIGLLMAIVSLVLLIASVNVAGMMLARATARSREMAVRLAIGANRGRLVRQILTETVLLFALGGAAGIVLSRWLTALLMRVIPQLPVPVSLEITTDWRVALFGLGLSLVAALLAGLVPAMHAARSNPAPALRTEAMDAGQPRLRLRNTLVVAQVTLSLLLLITAGLLARSLQEAASVNPGFDQDRVDVATMDLNLGGYNDQTGPQFAKELVARARALPGVESATIALDLPLDGGRHGMGALYAPGVQLPSGREQVQADWNTVEPGYFATMGIRLVTGRDFQDSDRAGAPRVAIVNSEMARQLWPGQDAVGRMLEIDAGSGREPTTVIGVAPDLHVISLGAPPEPYIYVPLAQSYTSRVSLIVRNRTATSALPQVRSLFRELNANLPIVEAMPLSEVTAIGLVPQRVAAAVAGSLGLVGLLLAATGIYGVTAYAVSRRTREIGIRMALGADSSQVLRLVLRQGLVLAAIGIVFGIVAAALGSRVLQNLLFGVGTLDPLTFAGASILFGAITVLASYIPARRAAQVDPVIALRTE
jgi:putative ABC transport system permease protein